MVFSFFQISRTDCELQRRPTETFTSNSTQSSSSDNKKDDPTNATGSVGSFVAELFLSAAVAFALTAGLRWGMRFLDEYRGEGGLEEASALPPNSKLYKLLQKRNKLLQNEEESVELPRLNAHELQIAEDVLDPDDMDACFADIAGIDDMKKEIFELAVLPLILKDANLMPKGILLYGKPGTGKTMLAKAIAKKAKACFFAIQPSKIMNKWYGESNKYVAAIFSLATKLAPSIVFLDEIDALLGEQAEHSTYNTSASLRAEFLTQWDGIHGGQSQRRKVLVLAATNRPHHMDAAILRRLPRTFRVPMPTQRGRLDILKSHLKTCDLDDSAESYLPELARETQGYSGSDLKELCQTASLEALHEAMSQLSHRAVMGEEVDESEFVLERRPISKEDLQLAKHKVHRTGQDANQYGQEEAQERQAQSTNRNNDMMMNQLALLSQLLATVNANGGDNGNDSVPIL